MIDVEPVRVAITRQNKSGLELLIGGMIERLRPNPNPPDHWAFDRQHKAPDRAN